ncbi:MAG: ribonuclease H-like domain-containing protein [Terriglobia bacterium]
MKSAYIDIETNYVGQFTDQRLFRDSKNHELTVVGIRAVTEADDSFIQLVGDQITKAAVMSALAGTKRLFTFNGRSIPDKVKGYTGFDFPVIAAQLGVVLDREFEHTDLCPECWKAGLYGGLKKVELTLGLKRELLGKDGLWAQEIWRQYKASGNARVLDELLAYNKEDVFMLRRVEEAILKS